MGRTVRPAGYTNIEPGDWDWLSDAACGDLPTELFFGHKGSVPPKVRETCERCPVRKDCFLFAVRYGERGVWAGMKDRVRNYIVSALRMELQAESLDETIVTKQDALDRIGSMSDDQFRSFVLRPPVSRKLRKRASC